MHGIFLFKRVNYIQLKEYHKIENLSIDKKMLKLAKKEFNKSLRNYFSTIIHRFIKKYQKILKIIDMTCDLCTKTYEVMS
ncbi:MAG: hypothetical protein COU51_01655 [Parcubacteria group bacterium CG10_big_fil_rev_8_21_14_0_10_36_14]|nr:MAG: hypothetical protein COU51_01655 [Parcubacteria group bacterium CG10_big_fil_rev_8_21_14_0_10_36_14]